jgi:AraC-like DNA-binding protein
LAAIVERINHASDWGRWTLVRARPSPALRGLVGDYEGYREAGAAPVTRRQRPIPRFPVILEFGEGWWMRPDRAGAAWRRERLSFVAGLTDHAVLVRAAGPAACIQIDLTPPGARRLLGLDLDALGDAVVPLSDLLGEGDVARLLDALAAAPDWPTRFARLDAFLVARMAAAPAPHAGIEAAWRLMARTGGAVPVGALARRLGLTREGFASRFRREVGIAPKRAARILRVDRAIGRMAVEPETGLAAIAAGCGFCDQAHMAREIRALCGETPSGLRRRLLPDGTGLMAGP